MTDTLETSTAGGAPSPNAFEYTYHVRYSEVGRRGLMTLPALINAFQDVSTFQSEALGVGLAWLRNEQRAWVLTHWHIVIDRYPSLCEPVTAGTFATHFRGLPPSATSTCAMRRAASSCAPIPRGRLWTSPPCVPAGPRRSTSRRTERAHPSRCPP